MNLKLTEEQAARLAELCRHEQNSMGEAGEMRQALPDLLDALATCKAELAAMELERQDLAMLVRRLCQGLKPNRDSIYRAKLTEQALDYLKRRGLQGNILREEPTQ